MKIQNDIQRLFVDADSLVYTNAWAAQQTHYRPLYKGKQYQENDFRYKKEYDKFLKEQKPEHQKHFDVEKIEVKLDLQVALNSIDKAIFFARKKLGASEVRCYLTDENKSNFRFAFATLLPYKATRTAAKPVFYNECRQHLIDRWDAEVVVGEEADDAVAQAQWPYYSALMSGNCETGDITCIAHIDKDINMVPGWHWSLNKNELYWVSELDGLRWFYTQLITGDKAVDNIPGLKHITDKSALAKFKTPLLEMTTEKEMYDHVYNLYELHKPEVLNRLDEDGDVEVYDYPGTHFVLNEIGNLLWMRRVKGEWWEAPK